MAGITNTGTDAGNYALVNTTATTTANITPLLLLTVSATGINKVYDGTTAATVTLTDNRVAGDVFTDADTSASFTDKNVGTGKVVAVAGITITGPQAGNYTLASTTATTTANITPLTLTVSATGVDKVYDGTTADSVSLTDNRLAGDILNDADTSAAFIDKNVGTGKVVAVSGIAITGADAGNYSLASTAASTTANITPRALTVSATGINKVYDGTTAATVTLADNRLAGDVFTDADTSATFTDKNVGNGKAVTVAGITITGPDAGNYSLTSTAATSTANITPMALTVSATGVNKIYDGTTADSVTLTDNRLAGDALNDADTSAAFTDKNVGTGKAVAVAGITIAGPDAGNYSLASTTATTTANITPMALTVSATGIDKVYDGTTAATVTLTDNRLAGDTLNDADTSAAFTDKNVGTGKVVAVSGIAITGPDAGNYSLISTTASTTANITPRALTVSATGLGKTYDGTTADTVTLTDNRLAGDALNDADTSAAFTDKNAGNGKVVAVSGIAITGPDAGNYSLTSTAATSTANITPMALTVSATGVNKIYDGTTADTVIITDNRLAGDALTDADTSASFTDKNVGTGKAVAVAGITITGPDAGNYSLASTTATTTANITPMALTVSATGVDKVYDGTTADSVTLTDNRVAGDALNDADTSAAFTDKNAGNGKVVAVSGIAITGPDAGNYSLTSTTASTTANITPRTLTVSATGINKVYDGTSADTVILTDDRLAGDALTDAETSAAFTDKNVGNGKVVAVSGITISGPDAANYSLAGTTASTTANITPRALTVSATGINKVYDGTTAATATLADNRITGDVLADADTSAVFADKNVGIGKTVTVAGIAITGTDAGNYSLANTTATTTASITQSALTLTVSATGINKVYDGTTAATVTLADNRVAGDIFTDADTSATFTDKNVGTGKAVTVAGITITGPDAGNYTLASTTATTTANITPLALTVSATGVDKVYDGTTAASTILTDNRVAGDMLTDADTSATFSDANVGTGKIVTVSGITITGPDAGNYTLAHTTASTTASITPAPLTITANNQTMVYGSTPPTLSASFSGLVKGNSPGSVAGLVLSTAPATSQAGQYPILAAGAVDPDYTIAYVPGTLTITPASLIITADDQSVSFGSPSPPLSAHYTGFVTGDSAANLSTPVQLSAPNSSSLPSGSYPIVGSGASSPDYAITFVGGTLTVGPITLPSNPTARASTSLLSTLYLDILGRTPDPVGLRYWRRRLQAGLSPKKVAQAFERSRERLAQSH